MKMLLTVLTAAGILFCASAGHAAFIQYSGGTYSQNFNGLITSGTGQAWANDSTITGWNLFTSAGNAITTYNAGDGSVNTGSFYSFGTGTASDRALGGTASGGAYFGSPASGAIAGWIAVAVQNVTGGTLGEFTISFSGEQWRNGGNATAQSMVLEYGFGATFGTVSSWVAPGGSFDWTSPVASATATTVDGNVAGSVTGRGGSITGLSWANTDTLWIRWVERNDAGNDHGLGIDDFSFITPVPEPTTWAGLIFGAIFFGTQVVRRLRNRPAAQNS